MEIFSSSTFTPARSESYQNLCDQHFPQLVYLLADDSPEELKKTKARQFLEATVLKRQKQWLASTKK